MLDWRGVAGTSVANGSLALMLAGSIMPLGGVCADCNGRWDWFSDPIVLRTFDIPAHVTVLPVQAVVQPIVATASPYRIDVRGPCPGQPPVDRLPAIQGSQAAVLPAIAACVRVDADGRVDRVHVLGVAPAGTDAALRRLTFVPAKRDGRTIASWVDVRGGR